MSQYQTKTKTVEALQWTGDNETEMKAFIGNFRDFKIMDDMTAIVQEQNNDVDFILPHSYVIKYGKTFASSTKESFERDYELKQQELFFEEIPIMISTGVAAFGNEGLCECWYVEVPENWLVYVCGWFSATTFVDVAKGVKGGNLDSLNIITFDDEKTEYTSLHDAQLVAEYIQGYFGEKYKSEL